MSRTTTLVQAFIPLAFPPAPCHGGHNLYPWPQGGVWDGTSQAELCPELSLLAWRRGWGGTLAPGEHLKQERISTEMSPPTHGVTDRGPVTPWESLHTVRLDPAPPAPSQFSSESCSMLGLAPLRCSELGLVT